MKLKLVESCITKPCICLFILFMHLSLTTAVWNNYLGIKSNSWRFANVSQVKLMLEKTECLAMCENMVGCETVNYNSVTKSCELLNPGPWIPSDISATESNWTVYYKGDRQIGAVDVWQTSTYTRVIALSADLAADGNRDNTGNVRCAHTEDYQSAWGMEFENEAEVSHVILYFNNNKRFNYRNANLRLLISGTRQDSANNIGTDCATYPGPPASPLPPVKVTCTLPVTGKFLKIMVTGHHLNLCEVEVFST
ncbi:uncharacterized protein LOC132736596 [Ruditapes philippinarum]|uniref:uncharacterized protein LOC132736596 n=1 Tax=Ruditapes philippinarum TaxID=129788 RepID=UPI00295B9CB6|nr:uncharacterized protein LOC132736596 [Ruditapes philippinarum]